VVTSDMHKDKVRPIWITWERQVRNRSLSKALNAKLYELDIEGGRFRRYSILSLRTIAILFRRESKIVFVQNPSLVLALLANIFGRVAGSKVIVDTHNGGLFPAEGRSALLNAIANFIVRISANTIVSNAALAEHVLSAGGRPLVLPDPLPDVNSDARGKLAKKSVLFICTWAEDEPYMEVLEAASGVDADIYITGRVPGHIAESHYGSIENIKLTGFLEENDYNALLHQADVVVDLTTRENCLVCGAYEAVAAGTPMVLSDTRALRTYFHKGAVYTPNDSAGIGRSINQALDENLQLTSQIEELKSELEQTWADSFNGLQQQLQL